MNAYELADAIDKYLDSILEEAIHPIEDVLDQAITVLRQQEVEIERITSKHEEMLTVKELTDEEIDAIGDEVSSLIDTYAGRRNFARAILRKAQENG